ncbi:MAG: cytochrome b/b6 domain-containing protein [Deltaproteobacteria bacterium]|nr:cytochrome b/b6 domain-containing protein [Deltaproteobacteria bacterium]
MSSRVARPLVHTVHLLTFTVLFASGLLLFIPDLRAAITGGYSLIVRESHRWGGVAFFVLPIIIIMKFGVRSVFVAPQERTLRSLWQGLHVVLTVLIGVVFTVTGVVLWANRSVPESLLDPSRDLHDWLTYVVAVLLLAHLVEVAVAALFARFRSAAGPAR